MACIWVIIQMTTQLRFYNIHPEKYKPCGKIESRKKYVDDITSKKPKKA